MHGKNVVSKVVQELKVSAALPLSYLTRCVGGLDSNQRHADYKVKFLLRLTKYIIG